jgi:type VII secretion-associated serine protease mycosin
MPGAHARRVAVEDRYLRGLRMVTGALAGLGILAAGVVPFATSGGARPVTRQAESVSSARAVAAAPPDIARADEWWLNTIHVPRAAKITKGSGIIVAVLDTGVDGSQADLTGRVVQGPDYTSGGRKPGGKYWGQHGTSMASIIAGRGHGASFSAGVLGVAPLAKILSIRVTLENDDPLRKNQALMAKSRDAVAKGIRYSVDHGADVINMSLGGGNTSYNGSPTDEAAVQYALSKGVVLIASMGNDGSSPGKKYFPAAYPGVIAVGTVDRKFKPWQGSNRGDYISLSAPGVNIACAGTNGGYVEVSGTSPSTAIVAGVAALVKAHYPALTPDQVKQALVRGVTHPPTGGRNDKVGAGVVDAAKALSVASTETTATPSGSVRPSPALTPLHTTVTSSVNPVLIAILVGGAALVVIGLVLGWKQRRRPEDPAPEPEIILAVEPDRPRGWPSYEPFEESAPLAAPTDAKPRFELPTEPFRMTDDDEPEPPSARHPFQVPAYMAQNGNGNGNGHHPSPMPEEAQAQEGANPWSDDPLGDQGSVPPGSAGAGTPLADQSWRSLREPDELDDPAGLSEDDLPTGTFPSVPPLGDTPPDPDDRTFSGDDHTAGRRSGPRDEDDFRPPWL